MYIEAVANDHIATIKTGNILRFTGLGFGCYMEIV